MAKDDLQRVKIKKGTFYLSSKEDKGEGWERNDFTLPARDGQPEQKMTRWHKEITLEGTVTWMGFRNGFNDIEMFGMIIKPEEGQGYSLEVPVEEGKKVVTINDYLTSIAGALTKVKKGDKVTMFINKDRKDKKDRLYKNIILLDSDNKLIKNDFNFQDVPKWKSEVTKDYKGEEVTVWDASETNAFYYGKLKEAVEGFGNKPKESNNTQSNDVPTSHENTTKYEPVEGLDDEDYDDLPF